MRLSILAFASALMLAAAPASAECYADYKAKQDSPLRLHYGVMQISDNSCSAGAAASEVRQRLASSGWTLLNVISVFGPEGLAERRGNAGSNYLRY